MRPASKARRVNSPGSARRKPGRRAELMLHCSNDRPAAVQVQLGHVLAGLGVRPGQPQHQRLVEQRRSARHAQPPQRRRRGSGSLPLPSATSAWPAAGPDTRTTAIAAGGRPDESAKMVGRALFTADP